MDERKGHYLGTELGGKWWRWYTRGGLFARGSGTYWCDDEAFYFRRYLSQNPIVLPYECIADVQMGRWHSGHWAWGHVVVKLLWTDGGRRLSSGFVLSTSAAESQNLAEGIRQRAAGRDAESAA